MRYVSSYGSFAHCTCCCGAARVKGAALWRTTTPHTCLPSCAPTTNCLLTFLHTFINRVATWPLPQSLLSSFTRRMSTRFPSTTLRHIPINSHNPLKLGPECRPTLPHNHPPPKLPPTSNPASPSHPLIPSHRIHHLLTIPRIHACVSNPLS